MNLAKLFPDKASAYIHIYNNRTSVRENIRTMPRTDNFIIIMPHFVFFTSNLIRMLRSKEYYEENLKSPIRGSG